MEAIQVRFIVDEEKTQNMVHKKSRRFENERPH